MQTFQIITDGPKGEANLQGMAAGAGACTGEHRGDKVNVLSHSGATVTRHFDLPAELGSRLPAGGFMLAGGVRVEMGPLPASGVSVEGPGSAAFQGSYGLPGMKSSLPSLPAGWAALISREAVKGGR